MNRDDNKNRSEQTEEETTSTNTGANRTQDDDQHSYPGKLDQVEGDMNNGEIGGGIQKQDKQNQ